MVLKEVPVTRFRSHFVFSSQGPRGCSQSCIVLFLPRLLRTRPRWSIAMEHACNAPPPQTAFAPLTNWYNLLFLGSRLRFVRTRKPTRINRCKINIVIEKTLGLKLRVRIIRIICPINRKTKKVRKILKITNSLTDISFQSSSISILTMWCIFARKYFHFT